MSMMGMVEMLNACELINRLGVASARLARPATSSYHCENRGSCVRAVSSPGTHTRSRPVESSRDAVLSRALGRNFTSPGPIEPGRYQAGVPRGERRRGHGNERRTGRPTRPGPGGEKRECPKKWNNPLTNCRCSQQMRIGAVPMP